jgi:uncharacterized protein YjbI with pentapeptide repeats
MRCKYVYKNDVMEVKHCEREAEPDSNYCFWHNPVKGKKLFDQKIKEKDLREAYLEEANLMAAEFEEGVNLSGANLKGADMMSTNLQGSDLMKAELQGAYLLGANLKGAYMMDANLQASDLTKAELQGAYLLRANLKGANLFRANLQGTRLFRAELCETDFLQADLEGAFLYQTSINESENLCHAWLGKRIIDEIIGDTYLRVKEEELEEEIKKVSQEALKQLELFNTNDNTKENVKNSIEGVLSQYQYISLFLNLNKSKEFYNQALDIYLSLKNYFRENGLYDMSGKYYVAEWRVKGKIEFVRYLIDRKVIKEVFKNLARSFSNLMRKNKKENQEKTVGTKLSTDFKNIIREFREMINNYIAWCLNRLHSFFSLYGESPKRVLYISILIIIAFASAYWVLRGVIPTKGLNVPQGFFNCLYFSSLTFFTFSYGEFQPKPSIRICTVFEMFLGAFILAYFVVVVSRKIMR